MLDLPGQPELDKGELIGGCVRFRIVADGARLAQEVAALPETYWGGTAGRIGVHRAAEAVFLRGHAPAEGNLPIEDRPALALLPYVAHFIRQELRAPPQRCLLARLPGGAAIAPHVDRAPYFSKTVRIHVPVVTHARTWMYCAGRVYRMGVGEVWALNNSTVHAVWSADDAPPRTHLICDVLPTPALLAQLREGERELGAATSLIPGRFDAAAGRAAA